MQNNFELYRFVLPIFLHGDLAHLCSNLIAQTMIGSSLEADIGSNKFIALYMLAGVGGVTFSALFTDTLSMGASTAVFGLCGCYIAFMILNYSYLAARQGRLWQIAIFIIISLFLTVMLSS